MNTRSRGAWVWSACLPITAGALACGARTDLDYPVRPDDAAAGTGASAGASGAGDSVTSDPCGPGLQAGAQWPMRGRCVTRNAISPTPGPRTAITKWVVSTGSAIDSSPAISRDGIIYFGSEDTMLYAINPDGTIRCKCARRLDRERCPRAGCGWNRLPITMAR